MSKMNYKSENFLFDDDILEDVFSDFIDTNDFDVDTVLPDLGDIQMEMDSAGATVGPTNNAMSTTTICNIASVETLGSSNSPPVYTVVPNQQNTLETLLKSMPSSSCVPPAPQISSSIPSGVSVIAGSSCYGAGIQQPTDHHLINLGCSDQQVHSITTTGYNYNDPSNVKYQQAGGFNNLSQKQQPSFIDQSQPNPNASLKTNLIGQLLKAGNSETDVKANNAAERKLELIRQLLEDGDLSLVVGSTAPAPPANQQMHRSVVNSSPAQPIAPMPTTTTSVTHNKAANMLQVRQHQAIRPQVQIQPLSVHQQNLGTPQQTPERPVHQMRTIPNQKLISPAPTLAATLATVSNTAHNSVVSAQASVTPKQHVAPLVSSQRLSIVEVTDKSEPDDDCDSQDESGGSPSLCDTSRGKPGRGRQSSHNAIEKRYRRSINDKIDELRQVLAEPEQNKNGVKTSKSCVLKKALERIKVLERENLKLRNELSSIKANHMTSDVMLPSENSLSCTYTTPPPSNASSSEPPHASDGLSSAGASPLSHSGSSTSPAYMIPYMTSQENKKSLTVPGVKRQAAKMETSPPPTVGVQEGGSQKLARLLLSDYPGNQDNNTTLNYDASNPMRVASRITLFMFACLLFVVSPVDYLTKGSIQTPFSTTGGIVSSGVASRHILSSPESDSMSLPSWLLWTGYALQGILAGLLLFGTPWGFHLPGGRRANKTEGEDKKVVVVKGGRQWVGGTGALVELHMTQAEREMRKESWTNAEAQLKAGLIALSSPLAIRSFDWSIQSLSQLVRLPLSMAGHFVHKQSANSEDSSLEAWKIGNICRINLSLVQLASLDLIAMTRFQLLTLVVSTYNRIVYGHHGLNADEITRAYICLGLAIKRCIPRFNTSITYWFFASALSMVQENSDLVSGGRWDWLRSNQGFNFLIHFTVKTRRSPSTDVEENEDDMAANTEENTFSMQGQSWQLVDLVKSALREKVLQDAMEAAAIGDTDALETALRLLDTLDLLAEEADVEVEETEDSQVFNRANDSANYARNRKESLSSTLPGSRGKFKKGGDPISLWWSRMARSAVLWQSESFSAVDDLHDHLVNPPLTLISSSQFSVGEALARRRLGSFQTPSTGDKIDEVSILSQKECFVMGVLLAYKSNRRSLQGTSEGNRDSGGVCTFVALQTVGRATKLLSVNVESERNRIAQLWRVVASDWLLNVRARLGSSSEDDLSKFATTLSLLRTAVRIAALDYKKWVLVHEATLRMLSGGNPLRTSLILRQCARDPRQRRIQLVKELIRNRSPRSNGVRTQS